MNIHSIARVIALFIAFGSELGNAATINLSDAQVGVRFVATGTPGGFKIVGKKDKSPGTIEGKVILEGTSLSSEAEIKLELLDTGIELRNTHMKEKYLEVAKYPKAVLKLDKVALPGQASTITDTGEIPFGGTLTLHGVTKPVSGLMKLAKNGNQTNWNLSFNIKLSDFSIPIPSFAGVNVKEEVSIEVEAEYATPLS